MSKSQKTGTFKKMRSGEGRLTGNLSKFDDIPDNVSQMSKRTRKGAKKRKRTEKVEKPLTGKPNNIIFEVNSTTFVEVDHNVAATKPKEVLVTDKPNNIHAPISYNQFGQ